MAAMQQSFASSSSLTTGRGALSAKEKHNFAKAYIPEPFTNELSLRMKVCPQYIASLSEDPVTKKRPRACRDGPLCKKLHCLPLAAPAERFACLQKYNMPYVSVYSLSTIPGDCRLYVRPPWHAAIKAYEESVLGQGSESTRVEACEHVSIKGVPFIKLTMQYMVEPTALSLIHI